MHVAVLSFTYVENDHRVLRTVKALAERGCRVSVIGFGGKPAEDCDFFPLPALPARTGLRLMMLLTRAPAGLFPGWAVPLHFLVHYHRAARAALLHVKPDVIHANDCLTLPSAVAAKQAVGARIVYDSHEFATEEHADNIRWRLVAQSHIREIERRFIGHADHIITVSDGIAQGLQALYALPVRPSVVRNTPAYEAIAPSPFTPPRHLLFHGIMKGGRGIEATIAAMRHLPDCVLTLRGNGAPAYEAGLRALATRLAVADRVTFEDYVPPTHVIRRASEAHIGVFCAPTETRHNRFAMPNKTFEYLMAGLAVVVTANTNLAELITQYGCGVAASSSTAEAIAAAINGINAEELAAMRARALEAAKQLCWEREQGNLKEVYDRLAAASAPAPSQSLRYRPGAAAMPS